MVQQISDVSSHHFSCDLQQEGKGKVKPRTGHESPEGEQRYTTLSLTSSLDGVGGQRHAPAALPPGKTRYLLYRRMGGPQGRSGLVQKISPHRDSIPGPFSPQRVAIPTELFRPISSRKGDFKIYRPRQTTLCLHIKEERKVRAHSMNGGHDRATPIRDRPHGRHTYTKKNNIKTVLTKRGVKLLRFPLRTPKFCEHSSE